MEGTTDAIEADPRGAWFRDVRLMLDAAEASPDPDVPEPSVNREIVTFFLTGFNGKKARRLFDVTEQVLSDALDVTFTGGPEDGASRANLYYTLKASMPSGLQVHIKAWADDVSEKRVTGQTVTEIVEYIRLRAEPEASTETVTTA